MIVSKVIKRAFRLLRVIDAHEEPSPDMQSDALDALNAMLASWSSQPQAIYAPALVSHTLTASVASYTWGASGAINSARPVEIKAAYVNDGAVDHILNVRAIKDYATIPLKTTPGIPGECVLRPSYPLATVYLFPVPDSGYTFKAEVLQPFTTYALSDDMALPLEYEDPITYQLALRIGPEYGEVPQAVAALAADMLRVLKRQYAKPVPVAKSSPFYVRRNDDIDGGM